MTSAMPRRDTSTPTNTEVCLNPVEEEEVEEEASGVCSGNAFPGVEVGVSWLEMPVKFAAADVEPEPCAVDKVLLAACDAFGVLASFGD
jgi:hypothetical protein